MTYKDILDSIEEMKYERPTDQTISILADLLYIRRHWHRAEEADVMEGIMVEADSGKRCLSPALAEVWCAHMENADGTTGPHWTMERIQQEMAQRGICCDPVEFWAVINAIYSDDSAVAKKHGVNNMDYYIDRARAWISDKDAVPDKAVAYYEHVVRH